MEPVLGLIASAIALSVGYLVTAERRRAQMRAWRQAAVRAGLAEVREADGGFFGSASLDGRSGDVAVRFEGYRKGKHSHGTRIVLGPRGQGGGGLSLRHEGLGTAIEKRVLGEREIEIGDQSFDDEFYVQGQAPLAIALLDPETRRRVAALLRNRIPTPLGGWVDVDASLNDGLLEVKVRESGWTGNRERIPDVLEVALDVARRLVVPQDVAARIAERLRGESSAGARAQAVRVLAREFPRHPATREALLAACQDPSDEVRLRAGIALGEDGRGTLLELVTATTAHDARAAQALSALGRSAPGEQVEAALRRALGKPRRVQTAQACLAALALLGRTEAEGVVRQALGSDDGAVAVAAARALGKLGTVAAVAALREAGEAGGEVRRAARQAIAEIQARLTGAEPGQLSLAGAEAGALSLAENAGAPGRLSIVEEGRESSPGGDQERETHATTKPQPKRVGQG